MYSRIFSRYLASLVILTCVMGMSACTKKEAHTELTPAQASELIAGLVDLIVIDVRTPAEYEAGHIEGAVNIDSAGQDFEKRLRSLDPHTPYLVYCRSGNRSQSALKIMTDAGFDKVYHLTEGYRAFSLHKE